jgi:ParB family transcriptional regulator, chromosome partitioning protein
MNNPDPVRMIPINRIRILNPRQRDKLKFQPIVESIKNLGLKKPIQVSLRATSEGEEPMYDLVCGQGRLEACLRLGFQEVPAVVVQLPKEDCLLRSLVENMARRHPATRDLINEIERLKAQGYNNSQIAKKLDICNSAVGELLTLKQNGEEGLLDAALRGSIPVSIAIEISKAGTLEAQRELLKAYEGGELNQSAIRTIKRLIEQRRFLGKAVRGVTRVRGKTSADGMVNAYKRESQRQKMIVKRARICEGKLTILTQAFAKLLADEAFNNLLRAEDLRTMPQYLADKLESKP